MPEYATKEYPGYVKENAEKHSWPAFCFVLYDTDKAAAGVAVRFSCAASGDDVERLCPCEKEVLDGGGSRNEQVVQGEEEEDEAEEYAFQYDVAGNEEDEEEEEKIAVRVKRGTSKEDKVAQEEEEEEAKPKYKSGVDE